MTELELVQTEIIRVLRLLQWTRFERFKLAELLANVSSMLANGQDPHKAIAEGLLECGIGGHSMSAAAKMVDEFHRRAGADCIAPEGPTVSVPGAADHVTYVFERAEELREAVAAGDVVKAADALGDLAYVVYGTAWRFGIPLDDVLEVIHSSNMTKTPTPGDGKAVKGPGYLPPDVAGVLFGKE
jgi:predicted HAD superfamily Cof-like phosphohydrolase